MSNAVWPLYLRKSSAFPARQSQEESGSAAGSKAVNLEIDATVKQSFAANRQAEPEVPSDDFAATHCETASRKLR